MTTIDHWISVPTPKYESLRPRSKIPYAYNEPGVAWYLSNYSKYEWTVAITDGIARAEKLKDPEGPRGELPPFPIQSSKEFRGRRISIKVNDGWLIGFNAGEWGGSLWWFSSDGNRSYKISDDQIVQFTTMHNRLYALAGLAHLTISEGSVIMLSKVGWSSSWTASQFAQLPQAPYACVVDQDGSLIIVLSSSLVRLTSTKKIEPLLSDTFWWGMYPNSIVIDKNGDVHIGMRQGIVRWHLGKGPEAVTWLVPSKEQLDEELRQFNHK